MKGKIIRDFDDHITSEQRLRFKNLKRKKIIEKKVSKKVNEIKEGLNRILVIGPNAGLMCHFSENIHNIFDKEGYDSKLISPPEIKPDKVYTKMGMAYPISKVLTKFDDWKPQLIIVDQTSLNFSNNQAVPVFYHHREFKRPPTVFYPTVVYLWHEDLIEYYKNIFAKEWMSQVQYHKIMRVAYNPDMWKLKEKIYKGVNAFGVRESFKQCYDMNEIANIADIKLLELEHNEIKNYVNYFEGQVLDNEFREKMPKCEAVWIPQSMRQYTSRGMLEAMACKTVCVIKLENERHKEILGYMGLKNNNHYFGIEKLSSLDNVDHALFEKHRERVIEDAYKVVSKKHTYLNRMKEIVSLYEEITNKKS